MKKFVFCFVIATLLIGLLVGCGPQVGCPTLVTASWNGQVIYSHTGSAYYSSNFYGYVEEYDLDYDVQSILMGRTYALLNVLGIDGMAVNFFEYLSNENTGLVTWENRIRFTSGSDKTCPAGGFTNNYDLVPDFNQEQYLSNNWKGISLTTQDLGSLVSFVIQNTIETKGDGASMSYTISKARLEPMLMAAYLGQPIPMATRDIDERDFGSDQEYGDALNNAVNNGQMVEVLTLNFPEKDLGGRTAIQLMMPRVLGMLAADFDDSYMAVLIGMINQEGRAMTSMSMSGGRVSTRKFFLGSTTTSTGSSMNFSQTATLADVYQASVFFVK